MSERLEAIESDELLEEGADGSWTAGDHYARMNIEAGNMGDAMYFSLPVFTILVKTQEELEAVNDEFAGLLYKYTNQIVVGTPHEASLILSINQAAADLDAQNVVIAFLRETIRDVTGSYEAAGDWEAPEE